MAQQEWSLQDLLSDRELSVPSVTVTGIALDSRKVTPGNLFIAVHGAVQDGARYIDAAVAAGARVIVGENERPNSLAPHIVYQRVKDSRETAASVAARFFPKQPDTIVAVTGTSGKSSVVDFYRQIMTQLGYEAASLGTIGVTTSKGVSYGTLTTPDSISLHEMLQQLSEEGITHLAMEASSHGIDQRRLDGVHLSAAAFTNIGRDHLDYHKTVEAYIDAKLRLFDKLLPENGQAVINKDGAYAERFLEVAQKHHFPIVSTGYNGHTLKLEHVTVKGFSQELLIRYEEKEYRILLPLAGEFQAENALVAAGLALTSLGKEKVSDILQSLASLRGVKGRLERVGKANGALCVVDYAHKPDALSQVLDTLRPFVQGRLICIFGCGGDRDHGKRPIMGKIAVEKADIVIVTDDNPRSEDPASIRAEILAAAPGAEEAGDRREAILSAVRRLQPGDILVAAGKGHETGQIAGDKTLPFSDELEIKNAIKEVFQ